MKNRITLSLLAAAAAAVLCASAASTAVSNTLTVAQREFAAEFVRAANAKDVTAMRTLVMPQSLSCYDKETEPYLDSWIQTRLRSAIPPGHTVMFSPYMGGPISGKFITAPAQPTETMQIDFRDRQEMSLFNSVRQDGGHYYLVAPCLTVEGAKHFKEDRAKRAASARKAHDAYAKLSYPLRSQLATLLGQGKKDEAFRLCKGELKLDSRTTLDVLELVAGRGPGEEVGGRSGPSAAATR